LGIGNLLDKTPKGSKIMETSGDGRQNEIIWEMSANSSGFASVKVTGVKSGTATLTVTATASGASGNGTITVP
jgi:hypothetical protein